MIVRSLLLIVSTILVEVTGNTSVLERYEERLNSALSHKHGAGPRTVKRYKCVEEYVTYDHNGKTVDSYQGTRFTTTVDPPVNVYRTNREQAEVREIRRKPARKVTIDIKRETDENVIITTPTTSVEQETTTKTEKAEESGSNLKPFDEMNDEEADRIIEEMYLKKKESHTMDLSAVLPPPPPPPPSPIQPLPVVLQTPSLPIIPVAPTYSTNNQFVDVVRTSPQPPRYNINRRPQKGNNIGPNQEDNFSPYYEHRGMRRRPFDKEYDEYDDFAYYRPMRRELRNHRRRPMLYTDDMSGDADLDNRGKGNPRQQMTRDLSPLRSMKRLRHQFPQDRTGSPLPSAPGAPVHQLSANPIFAPLPTAIQPNMMQNKFNQNPVPLQSAPPPPPPMPSPFAPPPPPGIPIGGDALKMKPLMQSSPQEMQEANEESCSKIRKLAKNFGIKDVSTWARSNCQFLQMYAPMASCELIFHFIDSCKKKNFF